MIVIYIIISLPILALMYLSIYCRFERSRAERVARVYSKATIESTPTQNTKHNAISSFLSFFERFSYGLMRYMIINVGKLPSYKFRNLLYRFVFCMDITKNTVIHGGCEFRSPWNIHADRCIIAVNCVFDGRSGIHIGQDVVFGSFIHIWTMEHSVNDSYFRVLNENAKPVVIGDHAWICSDTTILPGCSIEEGDVIAARACVVNNCVEKFAIYAGVPARKVGERNHNLVYKTGRKPSWLFY